MAVACQDAIKQFSTLLDKVDEQLKATFQNMHQGYPTATMMRYLKAREWCVPKAYKMLVDCLDWRIQNHIDDILKGLPVFAIGVGLSTLDKASVNQYVQSHIQINEYRDRVILPNATKKYGRHIGKCVKVLDMTGLKLSALSHIKLMTIITTIDDLNYPEKTQTYYVVNAPYVFSACWKVVKPLLQERTRRKIQILQGCGRDELLKIMDYDSLPHFCRRESNGSSRISSAGADDCYSLDHPFHQQLYNYIKQQALIQEYATLRKQGRFNIEVPIADTEGTKVVKKLESELHKVRDHSGLTHPLNCLHISGA
ncbi:phosphatidylinositol/phosphatidylcholine transfer protein SFH1-like isoform X2 [Musa acuminata AAA Group]|uniref:phosphatidylinositol/phosphatidylcholine transfer protein SFH1-like isoform X2 n=1 Tax=Musa acuminata AAA Group TaxID=214697 RepID=UPI0031E306A6